MGRTQKVIALVGPTASGKTGLGIELARHIDGEIVSADSRQVYQGLDVGTGKATASEMRGVPHHLIDIADPKETFTAADFVREGRAAIQDITARGKVPIIVGGTGFYIDALLGIVQLPDVAQNKKLRKKLADKTTEELNAELAELDPERSKTIDSKNRVRLVRAIEIARQKNFVPQAKSHTLKAVSLYDVLWLGIALPKAELDERISARLRARIEAGMLDEARKLHAKGLSYERMEELGLEYRYMAQHLKGELSYEEMLSTLEKEIRQYAKRQMTWFKKNEDIQWFRPEENQKIATLATNFLAL